MNFWLIALLIIVGVSLYLFIGMIINYLVFGDDDLVLLTAVAWPFLPVVYSYDIIEKCAKYIGLKLRKIIIKKLEERNDKRK